MQRITALVFSPKLVLFNNTDMKILNSKSISPFGGLNFVLAELTKLKVNDLLDQNLPLLPAQSVYQWKDIFYGYLSVLFCGGDCAEDISINLKSGLKDNPFYNVPSPDRLLDRLKTLAQPVQKVMERKSTVINEFGLNAPPTNSISNCLKGYHY